MIFRQAILKTKGDSEEIEQNFLPFSKRAKKNAYLEDPGIHIFDILELQNFVI
jgi:hypothetical protein